MLAPNFNVLLLSRLMSAAMHAPFFGVCMSVAATVAPPAKKTQAIALVQAGLTIAVMLGVPFGSFLGGFANWRVVFGFMIVLAIITMLGMIKFVPNVSLSAEANISKESTHFNCDCNYCVWLLWCVYYLYIYGANDTRFFSI